MMWDCHMHAFGPMDRYPPSPLRGYDPPVTSLAAYHAQAQAAGIGHSVFVQASIYGDDNTATRDALAASVGSARAVVTPWPDLAESDLGHLHAQGVRGLRLNRAAADTGAEPIIRRLMPALQRQGWHVAALLDTTAPGALDEMLAWITVPLVVDHFGRPPMGTTDPRAFDRLVAAIAAGRVWVKLSAPYQITEAAWSTLGAIARRLHWARPEATLFASNWPHIGAPDPAAVPDIADLVTLAADWLGLPRDRAATLLEGNAAALYA